MLSDFLVRVLTTAGTKGGCGMVTRPGYYSGRGATTSDLDHNKLVLIHAAIRDNAGKRAGKAFIKMVADIKVLSATDFLLALHALDNNKFCWTREMGRKARGGKQNGIHFESEGEAFGTFLSVLSNPNQRDDTWIIRNRFLMENGMSPGNPPPIHRYRHRCSF